MKKVHIKTMPVLCLFVSLLATYVLLWTNNHVAIPAGGIIYPRVFFEGEYKIGDGSWQEYRQGMHLSAKRSDITLKGTLTKKFPEIGENLGCVGKGDAIALYCDHLMIEIGEEGFEPIRLESEIPKYEFTCAKLWQPYIYRGEVGKEVEIQISSPHKFGNENAVDEMLENMYLYAGYDFEEDRIKEGSLQRTIGLLILLSACCMLGIFVFAGRIHIRGNLYLWIMTLLMAFAGGYVILSSPNVNLWNPNHDFNTVALGICMMLYQYFVTLLITYGLGRKTKKIGQTLVHISGLLPAVLIGISVAFKIHFYGTWGIWVIIEALVSLFLLFFVWYDVKEMDSHKKILQVASSVPLVCFLLDALATGIGWWQGGKASLLVFYIYALMAFVVVVRIVPQKINEAARAKELEEEQRKLQQELKDRRVSVMMSQIRTHFIFNVMTIISGLCNSDPQKADDAIILFARYLRKNISIMERDEPILFSQELQHLEDYIYLEKMRFGEKITVEKNLEVTDFKIPPLTIQPLMENAIKHGLLASGKTGTVILSSKKTDEGIQITIEDDGVGFVPEALEKEDAVGIRNVRYRLENMVGGTLNIVSIPGKGTKVEIRLPWNHS